MWNKRKLYSLLLVGLALILATSVMACAPPATPTEPSPTPKPTPKPTPPPLPPKPRGSVLENKGEYLGEEGRAVGYWRYQIITRVQNLGDTGIISVIAEITPEDVVDEGRNLKTTEVYLHQGEEKQLRFYFWVKWPNEGFGYRVIAVP